MSQEIDIDLGELLSFTEALQVFHRSVEQVWQQVEGDWSIASDTWKGAKREQFEGEFLTTQQATAQAIESITEAVDWLLRFQEILSEL